jgi:hypothetical protein
MENSFLPVIPKRTARNLVLLVAMLTGAQLSAQTLTATQTVGLSLAASAVVYSVPPTLSLLLGSLFSTFSGSVTVSSEIRTTATGSGTLTLQASSFTPIGGPNASTGDLTYQCSAASYGTACSGTVTASTTSATSVATYAASSCTGGGGSCSPSDPNTVVVQFIIADKSTYETGIYLTSITFTMSAT